jgi:hypothetical protein
MFGLGCACYALRNHKRGVVKPPPAIMASIGCLINVLVR